KQHEQWNLIAENMLKIGMEKRHRRDAHQPDEPPGNDAVIVQGWKEPAREEDTPDRPDENHDARDLVADRVRFRRHRQVRSHELAPASCTKRNSSAITTKLSGPAGRDDR